MRHLRVLSIVVALIILGAVSFHRWRSIREIGKVTLTKDTIWEGDVIVTGDVHISAGVTLTIAPGSKIRFRKLDEGSDRNLFGTESPYYPQTEIIVTGRLVARGTPDRPILFSSAEGKPKPADWGTLNFLGGGGNVVENCRIEYAYNAIHAHGAQVLVKNSILVQNTIAISFKKEEEAKGTPGFGIPSDLTITGNLIEENKGGINVRSSHARVVRNTIRNNKFFGVWVKEQSSGEISRNIVTGNGRGMFFYKAEAMKIRENNIYRNLEYNLAMADEQETDIPIAGNWFGTSDPARIEETLFDGRTDSGLGRFVITPFLPGLVPGAGR